MFCSMYGKDEDEADGCSARSLEGDGDEQVSMVRDGCVRKEGVKEKSIHSDAREKINI